MHNLSEAELTDSMKMFRLGVEGGKPAPGKIGTAPEWFYKGTGTISARPRRTSRSARLMAKMAAKKRNLRVSISSTLTAIRAASA